MRSFLQSASSFFGVYSLYIHQYRAVNDIQFLRNMTEFAIMVMYTNTKLSDGENLYFLGVKCMYEAV